MPTVQERPILNGVKRLGAFLAFEVVTQGAVVVNHDGENLLLVQRHLEEGWSFPSTLLRRGERPETAAQRALLTECGIVTTVLGTDRLDVRRLPWRRHVEYIFRINCPGKPKPTSSSIRNADWHPFESLPLLSRTAAHLSATVDDIKTPVSQRSGTAVQVTNESDRLPRQPVFIAILIGLIVVSIAIGIGVFTLETPWLKGAKYLVLPGTLLFAAYFFWLRYKTATRTKSSGSRPAHPEISEIGEFADSSRGKVTLDIAQSYYRVAITPLEIASRISERVEPYNRSYECTSAITIDNTAIANHPLPLLLTPKGALIDGLKVFGERGDRISTLTQVESLGYCYSVILSLVTHAFRSPDDAVNFLSVERQRTMLIALGRGVSSGENTSLNRELSRLLEKLETEDAQLGGLLTKHGSDLLLLAGRLLRMFTYSQVICIQRPSASEERIRVTFRRRVTPRPGYAQHGRWIQRLLGQLFGAMPNLLTIPIEMADRARSYHLEVRGPESTYLGRQGFVQAENPRPVKLINVPYNIQRRRGQRHAHLYIRTQQSLQSIYFQTEFFERTPGAVGKAGLLTSVTALVIFLIYRNVEFGVAADSAPALLSMLLAVPAGLSAWIGFSANQRPYTGGIITPLSTLTMAFLAATAAVLVTLPQTSETRTLWLAVASSAAVVAALTLAEWLARTLTQHWFISRTD